MMDLQVWAGAIAAILGAASYVWYGWTIHTGATKPHAFSWLIWAINNTVVFVGQVKEGAGPGAWVTAMAVVGPALVFAAALWLGRVGRSDVRIDRTDWMILAMALAAMALLVGITDPLAALLLAVTVEIIGYLPTFRKVGIDPTNEAVAPHVVSASKVAFALCALSTVSFSTTLWPITVLVLDLALIGQIVALRRVTKQPRTPSTPEEVRHAQ